jgi:hypothetical protein
MEIEDGVIGVGEGGVVAFNDFGIGSPIELIAMVVREES